jgi:hypothetical protein
VRLGVDCPGLITGFCNNLGFDCNPLMMEHLCNDINGFCAALGNSFDLNCLTRDIFREMILVLIMNHLYKDKDKSHNISLDNTISDEIIFCEMIAKHRAYMKQNTTSSSALSTSCSYSSDSTSALSTSCSSSSSTSAPPNDSSSDRSECIISFRDSGVKSHPFVISNTNLTFDQIPFVTGVPIKRQFYPHRSHLAPANFETTSGWPIIEATIKGFFDSKGIRYCLPGIIAVFSVHGIDADPNLVFDVHCCPRPIDVVTNSSSFVIEFRRVRGDAFVLSKLFFELKAKLGVDNTASASTTALSTTVSTSGDSTTIFAKIRTRWILPIIQSIVSDYLKTKKIAHSMDTDTVTVTSHDFSIKSYSGPLTILPDMPPLYHIVEFHIKNHDSKTIIQCDLVSELIELLVDPENPNCDNPP